jgi:hypothetical protein
MLVTVTGKRSNGNRRDKWDKELVGEEERRNS